MGDLSVSAFLDPAAPFTPYFPNSSIEVSLAGKLEKILSIYTK
jgi:hypothetical protein